MKSLISSCTLLKNENKSKSAILRLSEIKSLILLIVLVLIKCIFITSAIAQAPPVVEWDARFGGSADEGMYTVLPTSDGGYIAGGASWSGVSGQKTKENKGQTDYWIVKMDGTGVKQWDMDFGGALYDHFRGMQQTSDDGYILLGNSYSDIGGDKSQNNRGLTTTNDYWIVKTDAGGSKLWDSTFGGSNREFSYSIRQTKDNGYLIGGYSNSPISGDKTEANRDSTNLTYDYWVVKTDEYGTKEWDKRFGGKGNDYLYSIDETSDGGYILGGASNSGLDGDKSTTGQGNLDYWILKIDSTGQKQWDASFGGSDMEELISVQQTSDGGFILGGYSYSGAGEQKSQSSQGLSDYWIVKTDSAGMKEWDVRFGGIDEDKLQSVRQTSDDGFILAGYSFSGNSGDKSQVSQGSVDYWLVKTNSQGEKQWDARFGGSKDDILFSLEQISDDAFIIGGSSHSGISGDKTESCEGIHDYWIVKLNCEAPDVTVSPSGTINACKGDAITFTASGNNITSYQWHRDGAIVAGQTDATFSSTTGTSFYVTASNGSCSSSSAIVDVVRNNKPAATITPQGNLDICGTGSVTLQANGGSNLNYKWLKGGAAIPGETNQTFTAITTGKFKVVVTNSSGCSKTSAITQVTKSCRETSAGNGEGHDLFNIYPNPAKGQFVVDLNLEEKSDEPVTICVINMLGQTIHEQKEEVMNGQLSSSVMLNNSISSGIYSVRVIMDDQVYSMQLVLER